MQIKHQFGPSFVGGENNPLHEIANHRGGFGSVCRVVQRRDEPADFLAIALRHTRVDGRRRFVSIADQLFQLPHASLGRIVFGLQLVVAIAIADGLDHTIGVPVELAEFGLVARQRCIVRAPQLVHVTYVFAAELLAERRVHQVGFEGTQHRGFQHILPDGQPVAADALRPRIEAAAMRLRDLAEAAAAFAALEQEREEIRGAPLVPELGGVLLQRRLPRLYGGPELVGDDAQLRHLTDQPFAFRVLPGHALTGIRVLDVAQAVPNQPAEIELIVEHAGAAAPVAVNGRGTPAFARRTGHALAVQRDGDRLR